MSRLRLPEIHEIARPFALAWTAAVVAISLAAQARPGWIVSLAASPDRIREGKLWYLVSSGMLVDRPITISLVSFVALAALSLLVCGVRIFWWAAFLGQVAATLLVYTVIGVIRALVPAALVSVVASPDFGVSTISAAWLGAIATVGWCARGRSTVGRWWIGVSCVAVGLFAYSVRPDIGPLSSEHLVAFGLGITAATPGFWTRVLDAVWRRPLAAARLVLLTRRRSRAWLSIAAAAPVALAIAAAPSALAALRHEIQLHLPPTVTRCVYDWNGLSAAPRTLVANGSTATASVSVSRAVIVRGFGMDSRPPVWADYCRLALVNERDTIVVLGRWRHGRVDSWTIAADSRAAAPRTRNASVRPDGRLRLLHRKGPHLTLTS